MNKLDEMAKAGLFGSRGRVVQALVDEVLEVQASLKNVGEALGEGLRNPPIDQIKIGIIAAGITDVTRRLEKFAKR